MNKYDTEPSQGSTVNMTRVIGIYEENDQNQREKKFKRHVTHTGSTQLRT